MDVDFKLKELFFFIFYFFFLISIKFNLGIFRNITAIIYYSGMFESPPVLSRSKQVLLLTASNLSQSRQTMDRLMI